MNEETAATIRKLIEELDRAVPKDGVQVQLSEYGGGADEGKIIATREGYLRLGIEFLRGAFAAPSSKAPARIAIDLDYLISGDSDIGFGWFERVDCLPAPPPGASDRSSTWSVVGCMGLFVCIAAFSIVGFVTVIQWLFHP